VKCNVAFAKPAGGAWNLETGTGESGFGDVAAGPGPKPPARIAIAASPEPRRRRCAQARPYPSFSRQIFCLAGTLAATLRRISTRFIC